MSSQPSLDHQIQWLVEDGWKEWKKYDYDNFDRIWYKKFPDEPRCQLNLDKPMQAAVRLWDFRKYRADAGFGFDVHLRGEVARHKSVSVTSGSISNVNMEVGSTLELLFKMWRAGNV